MLSAKEKNKGRKTGSIEGNENNRYGNLGRIY